MRSTNRSLALIAALAVLATPSGAQNVGPAPQGLTAYRPQHGPGYFPFTRTYDRMSFQQTASGAYGG